MKSASGKELWRNDNTPTRAHIVDGGHGEQTNATHDRDGVLDLRLDGRDEHVVVCGSLYLVAELRQGVLASHSTMEFVPETL